jgi:phosphate transport system protein
MRTRFQQGLDDLRERLLRMGGLAEQAVDRACQAYIDRDLVRCHMVLEGESLINAAEREIDEVAFDLLAMQQPMAVDLRFILAVTKINSDLERVGDQAVNIAERVMDMVELPKVELPVDIARMAAAVSAMVRRALESFIEGKAELAHAVLEMDNVVDRMRDEAFIMLVKAMNDRPEVTRQALDALLVARNLERVADHATNIAEDVIFWVRGADVRHNAPQVEVSNQQQITDTH